MKNAKIFSKLDVSSGYWQIKVDQESLKLLAFLTPRGRYKFNRMPFGIHSASEIFQAEIAQIISGIKGTDNMQDDIIVWAETQDEREEPRSHDILNEKGNVIRQNWRYLIPTKEEFNTIPPEETTQNNSGSTTRHEVNSGSSSERAYVTRYGRVI